MEEPGVFETVATRAPTGDASTPVSRTAAEAATGVGRVLETVAFVTSHGERGQLELLRDRRGLVLVHKLRLVDGSILEWTKALLDSSDLLRAVGGIRMLSGGNDADRRFVRKANEHLAKLLGD